MFPSPEERIGDKGPTLRSGTARAETQFVLSGEEVDY